MAEQFHRPRILHAASRRFTQITREEIEAKVRVYAPNPSFKQARDKLEAEHVIIISGPPGVGKTTLAEMISYAYLGEEWEYVAIRGLDDGFAAIVDTRKQIFFFDDFLGRAALDTKSLAAHDTELAKFIKRVRRSKNARFVLTTRAPIFEEARRVSEHLADRALDITKYVLDVGVYTGVSGPEFSTTTSSSRGRHARIFRLCETPKRFPKSSIIRTTIPASLKR